MKKLLVVLLSLGLILAFIKTASAADVNYYFGKVAAFDSGADKTDYVALGPAYIKAKVYLGPVYVGILAQYASGGEGSDKTMVRYGPQSQDLHFGLILGNGALQTWEASNGNGGTKGVAPFDGGKAGSMMYSVFGGFNATPKLNVNAMLVATPQNKESANKYVSKSMGTEIDITARYQIYDNLSYMLGAGYLWTGDHFKGINSTGAVGNDYLLMNRLSLSF